MFSHLSKLDLIDTAQTASYTVVLRAVLIPEELAVLRVRHRVGAGAMMCPKTRSGNATDVFGIPSLQPPARADSATFYDNSAVRGPRIVAQLSAGFLVGSPTRPTWTPAALTAQWPADTSPG